MADERVNKCLRRLVRSLPGVGLERIKLKSGKLLLNKGDGESNLVVGLWMTSRTLVAAFRLKSLCMSAIRETMAEIESLGGEQVLREAWELLGEAHNVLHKSEKKVGAEDTLRVVTILDKVFNILSYDSRSYEEERDTKKSQPWFPMPHDVYWALATALPNCRSALLTLIREAGEVGVSALRNCDIDSKSLHARGRSPPDVDSKSLVTEIEGANPLLKLHVARMLEGALLIYKSGLFRDEATYAAAIKQHRERLSRAQKRRKKRKRKSGAVEQQPENPLEPPAAQLLYEYRDVCRTFTCFTYAFATPNEAALEALERCGPLLELGAGVGYWASLLRDRGVDIVALDAAPTTESRNEYHGRAHAWTEVKRGGANDLAKHGAAERTLFLCYPPPGPSSMSQEAVERYTACGGGHSPTKRLVLVGEWQGDTGSRDLEAMLLKKWKLRERIQLPNWSDTADELTIWELSKIGNAVEDEQQESLSMQACGQCGKSARVNGSVVKLRRCRFCRSWSGTFCSEECAAKSQAHQWTHLMRYIYIEKPMQFGNDVDYCELVT